jgi:hypothetical protein
MRPCEPPAEYIELCHQVQRNPALNLAVPSILALLPTPDEPPDRHPFKSAASMCN